jgi:hypothetical protein
MFSTIAAAASTAFSVMLLSLRFAGRLRRARMLLVDANEAIRLRVRERAQQHA